MGFVPEQPFLYGELTVGEMLHFVARGARARRRRRRGARAGRLLALLGLEGAEGVLCRELSQGMGRKVALIAALLHRPAGAGARRGVQRPRPLLRRAARRGAGGAPRRRAAAVLLSSHDLAFLAALVRPRSAPCPGRPVIATLDGAAWERWQAPRPRSRSEVAGAVGRRRGRHRTAEGDYMQTTRRSRLAALARAAALAGVRRARLPAARGDAAERAGRRAWASAAGRCWSACRW